MVECLMYAIVCNKSDIAHVFGIVSRFLENLGKEQLKAVNWILRYLRDITEDYLYFGGSDPILKDYIDTDITGDLDNRK